MALEDNELVLSRLLAPDVLNLIKQYPKQKRAKTAHVLASYSKLLCAPLMENDVPKLTTNLIHVRSHLCAKYTRTNANAKLQTLRTLIRDLIKEKKLSPTGCLPEPTSEETYQLYRQSPIPHDVLVKIDVELSAEEEFELVLASTCPQEISKRLREHVNSFKHAKHHRAPLARFLKQVSSYEPEWYLNPRVIQGELIKFRGNILDDTQRNTAYGAFQNVKNAIKVLIEHGLLPSDTDLPDNLRRCTATQKVRSDNPLICKSDLYDERNKQRFIDSASFIDDLIVEISSNLEMLVARAQAIVYDAYRHFLATKDVIERSQRDEFLAHPNFRVAKFPGTKAPNEINPFYSKHPLQHENLTAYYEQNFDELVQVESSQNITHLRANTEIRMRLGLVPFVASAMQIIIVEELGINPYSLYRVKIASDGHGKEFVQITDEGSVRLKALKPRAKKILSKKTKKSLVPLSHLTPGNIDAAACLKMAIEMTNRARGAAQRNDLWICLSKNGASLPQPETFQNNFNIIRERASEEHPAILKATLKKIRTSKGVLIYLRSRGDSISTAAYFGNAVKTTLDRYIPPYLAELVYRIKIRAFQDILLFMAVAENESPAESLGMNNADFESQIKRAFSNPDMGGNLYGKLTPPPSDPESTKIKYFCVSQKNIELAIRYAKHGKEAEIVQDCEKALQKIAEGPVAMKQLLRSAQISVEKYNAGA